MHVAANRKLRVVQAELDYTVAVTI